MRVSGGIAVVPAKPFRLRAPVIAEDDLQAAVADALGKLLMPPAVWTALPIGHVKLAPAQAARLARIGTQRGWPDLIVLHGGRFHGIELKRPGGRLSRTRTVRTKRGALRVLEGQEDVWPRLEAAGARLAVCSTVDAVLNRLSGWDVPLRRWT